MQLRTFVLPIRVQTSSLGPSGVVYQMGIGVNFLPSLCFWVRLAFTGSSGLQVATPASSTGTLLGSKVLPLEFRLSPWDPPGPCIALGLVVIAPSLRYWVRWLFTGSANLQVRTPAFL